MTRVTRRNGFGLIDTDTANVIGYYNSEAAALRDVTADIRRLGRDALCDIALFRWDASGQIDLIAKGAGLVRHALRTETAAHGVRVTVANPDPAGE